LNSLKFHLQAHSTPTRPYPNPFNSGLPGNLPKAYLSRPDADWAGQAARAREAYTVALLQWKGLGDGAAVQRLERALGRL